MATFPISDDRINLDLFPPGPCPALPTEGQIWPQGLFLGSYANLSTPTPPPPAEPPIPLQDVAYSKNDVWWSGFDPAYETPLGNPSFWDGLATQGGAVAQGGYIKMDLGQIYTVDRIFIGSWYNGFSPPWSVTNSNDVLYSVDGTTWSTAFSLVGEFTDTSIKQFNVNLEARYFAIKNINFDDYIGASEFYALAPGQVLTDPYWTDVTRLYSFSNEPITDASLSESNPTLVNDVQIVNDQSPFAGGGSSAYFNGTSSYIEVPTISLSSFTDLTVEFWIRPEEGSRIHTVLIGNPNYASKDRILVDNFNRFIVSNNNDGPTVTLGVWHHLAFVRSSNVEKGYVNGVGYTYGVETVARSYDRIGNVIADGSPVWYLKGWLSNMRITPGIARYTADFTPPTAPFPNS